MARKKKPAAESPSLFDTSGAESGGPPPPASRPNDVPGLPADLPAAWLTALEPETQKPYWADLMRFVAAERAAHDVYPPESDVFNAFRFTPLEKVEVLLLGQDPYPTPGVAHGLCFSVRPGVRLPASLRNIYRELEDDVGAKPVTHGYLAAWARRGVLMLNACLTVRSGAPNSHSGKGWEKFTDAAIRAVNDKKRPVVFLLWGSYAQKKEKLIDTTRHVVIKGVHPSPLSADKGFFGSKPFSKINAALEAAGEKPIDWQLPENPD
ncbi:MAG: ung [Gemmataceae bacterium]|nr:ung [Gemmataceae bacterium]